MKITVLVKTKSRDKKVIPNSDGGLTVHLKAMPHDGKANKELIDTLADYFSVPKSCVKISSGLKSKTKIVSIG